jgi:group I intron endonuclease
MIIYKITHKQSGKCYVGQTTRSIKRRLKEHKNSSYCARLYHAIKKYGIDAFSIDIVAEYDNLEDLNNAEEYYINYYNSLSPNGYNLLTGGKNKKHSEESKQKMSAALKGKSKPWLKGKGPFEGKRHSEESKKKMSLGQKGNTAHLGKSHSTETKIRISLAKKGKHSSIKTEFKKGKENPMFGKHHTEETKAKMSAAKKGKSSPRKGIPWSENRRQAFLSRKSVK